MKNGTITLKENALRQEGKKLTEKKDQNNSDDDKRKIIEREQGRDSLKLRDMYHSVQLPAKSKKHFIGEL